MSKKGSKWTDDEDKKLTKAVEDLSCSECNNFYRADCPCQVFTKKATWESIAKKLGRTHGGVQGRWCSVLDPKLDRSPWTPELDDKLLEIFKTIPTWSARARELSLPGVRRNGGDVASRYFLLIKKKTSSSKNDSKRLKNEEEAE